jgi:hypothetical protein
MSMLISPTTNVLARRCLRLLAATALAAALAQPASAAYVLAPQYAGSFAAGTGADAEFNRIANEWSGSAVLWNEDTRTFGNGAPIGSFSWGTGLWGQVDWRAVQQAAAGQPSAATGAIVQNNVGLVDQINQGNSRYNECYSATWGAAALIPFFTPVAPVGNCGDPEAGAADQQNWTAHYSGYIRITDAGDYNFSVLHDDGFFFRLIGADGAEASIGRDYLNPRDRVGFDQNLTLAAGLYGFELGAWNRLGAGIVDLRWANGCTSSIERCDWDLVPVEHLVSASQVPEPPTLALVLGALATLQLARTRRRAARWRNASCSRQDA